MPVSSRKNYPVHYIVARERAVGATDVELVEQMPALPLSHLLLTLDFQTVAANVADDWRIILDQLLMVSFRFRGMNIWSMRGTDLYRVSSALSRWSSVPYVASIAAASRRLLTIAIPFGRHLYDPTECFPGVTKGETELSIQWDAATPTYNNIVYTLEAVMLPGAQPKQFMRGTTLSITPTATGDVDVDLPRGAPLAGLGYVTSASEPVSANATLDSIKILLDNVDTWYPSIHNNTARALAIGRGDGGLAMTNLTFAENQAAAYTQYANTLTQKSANGVLTEFGWLPFDVLEDGAYALDGRGAGDLKARLTFLTAANVRLLPVEIWTPTQLGDLRS